MTPRQLSLDSVGEPIFQVVEPSHAGHDGSVLAVTGELDRDTAGLLLDALVRAPGAGGTIALDLAGLTFIDAAGARSLLACRSIAAGHGMMLTVRNLRPAVRRVLEILDILGRLETP
ncbi:STAS domain-containing protein [Actinoplanes sp. NPDC051470]|uniref:STAS domain-containing protein n=1 Tax=Actinoplanes sp. NPDC051470 TaxID=3157224 RepID=UPI00341C4D2E